MKSSVLVLIPYFGQWPFWIDLFLASCEKNPTVDWLLIGDCGEPAGLPLNVAYRYQSFDDYKSLVSCKLGINFRNASPYKLCDIKPMLGFIHEDEVSGYDFWAFGDLDLIYGDLRSVYTEELLRRYTLISNHATRVSGHLCLIRNSSAMRNVFRKVPDWQRMLESEKHFAFDEKAFSRLFVKHKNFPGWLRNITNRLYPRVRKSMFVERYTTPGGYIPWKDGSKNYPKLWYWQGGRLWNDFESEANYPYFHFYSWKKSWDAVALPAYDASVIYCFSSAGISVVREMQSFQEDAECGSLQNAHARRDRDGC